MPVPLEVDLVMRGGEHPDAEMNAVESQIAELAFQKFLTSPQWNELGLKKAYNLTHFFTFWMTRNPQLIKLINRLQPYPSYLEFEVAQGCPFQCKMCETTYPTSWEGEKTEIISWKQFKHIIDQFPDLKWCGANAIGEPNLNKDYFKMLKYMSDRGICQEQYTTFQMLEEKDMEKYVKMGFEYIKVSLDAVTPETWKKIRPNMDFQKTIDNTKALDYYKKKHGKHWPEIHFHYLITKETIGEAEQFLDMVDSLGIDVGGIYYSRLLHNFKELGDTFIEVPPELTVRIAEKAKKLGLVVNFSQDMPHMWPPANECMAWQMPYIFLDGSVISCCCMNLQGRRWWQRETCMGNIHKKPFREIWNDKPYRQLREFLWDGKIKEAHPVCNMCNIYNKECVSDIRGAKK